MSAEERVGPVGRKWAVPAPETSGFSQTCNLLRQFLKGKGGSLKDISPQIASHLEAKTKGTDDNSCTKEIKLGNAAPKPFFIEDQEKKMTQMTIFYAGKVTVFDHLPPEKASHLLTTLAAVAAATTHQVQSTPQSPAGGAADLPIARRVSLHRFLDKRKARVMAKGPYTISSPKKL